MSPSDALWLKTWELVATIGFIMILVGVVIEGVEHFKKFTKKEHARKLHIEKIGWLILVAGLAAEFLGDQAAKRISGRENARLNKEAGDARWEAGEANERSKQLEATNLVLRAKVLELQLATLPRWMRFRQWEFAEALKGKPKIPVQLLYQPNNNDSYILAGKIEQELRFNGWPVVAFRELAESDIDPRFTNLAYFKNIPLSARVDGNATYGNFCFEWRGLHPTTNFDWSGIAAIKDALAKAGIPKLGDANWVENAGSENTSIPEKTLRLIVP